MFFNKIFEKKARRSVENHKKPITISSKYLEYIGSEGRNLRNRDIDKDRKRDVGSRSGIYYKLSDKQKNDVDTIIDFLEITSMGKR